MTEFFIYCLEQALVVLVGGLTIVSIFWLLVVVVAVLIVVLKMTAELK